MANKPLVSKRFPVGHLLNPQTPWSRHSDVRRTIEEAKRRLERERQQKEPVKWEISRSPSS